MASNAATWYSVDQVINLVFTGVDGKHLISKTTFLKLCHNGSIKIHRLGLTRKIFIHASEVERLQNLK